MRWLWFLFAALLCFLAALFTRQPLVLLSLVPLLDILITHTVKWPWINNHPKKKRKTWIGLLIWAILTGLIIRIFVLDSLYVGDDHSRNELQQGDCVLISKLSYGPRLPVTPLHLPFTNNYLPFSKTRLSYTEWPHLQPVRMNGLTAIKRNDLVAFNFPEGDSVVTGQDNLSFYALRRQAMITGNESKMIIQTEYRPVDRRKNEISRCKGLPGDTITIDKGRVFVNGKLEGCLQKTSFNHLIEKEINDSLVKVLLNTYHLKAREIRRYPGLGILMPLRIDQQIEVATSFKTKVNPVMLSSGQGDYNIFPHDIRFPWNRDNLGPIILPGKGDSVRLTPENLPIYERIIRVYENNHLEVRSDEIRINGISTKYYTFRQNYYFVLGDNRHHSRDSRHWGFLPEDHITGKPILIWFSSRVDSNLTTRILWKRMLRVPV